MSCVYIVRPDFSITRSAFTVIRCPNSTNEAINDNPKMPDVNVIIDGVEYVKKEK